MSQSDRFRDKMRARNLGGVEVQTYPANPAAADQVRVLSKLELHRKAQLEQDSAPALAAPVEPKKSEAKQADDKRK